MKAFISLKLFVIKALVLRIRNTIFNRKYFLLLGLFLLNMQNSFYSFFGHITFKTFTSVLCTLLSFLNNKIVLGRPTFILFFISFFCVLIWQVIIMSFKVKFSFKHYNSNVSMFVQCRTICS